MSLTPLTDLVRFDVDYTTGRPRYLAVVCWGYSKLVGAEVLPLEEFVRHGDEKVFFLQFVVKLCLWPGSACV